MNIAPEEIRQVWTAGLVRALHHVLDAAPDPHFAAWDQTVFELFSLFPDSSLAREWQVLRKEEKLERFASHHFSFEQFSQDFEAGMEEGTITTHTKEE